MGNLLGRVARDIELGAWFRPRHWLAQAVLLAFGWPAYGVSVAALWVAGGAEATSRWIEGRR